MAHRAGREVRYCLQVRGWKSSFDKANLIKYESTPGLRCNHEQSLKTVKKEVIPNRVHVPHEEQKLDLGTDWWWELYYCLREGRGASKEHMELYKLFGAPRKTGKIIIYISETAHFSLQPSGTQTSRGQRFVQQNSHKYVWGKATEGRIAAGGCASNTSGRKNCWLCSWSWFLPASLTWDFYGLSPFCWDGDFLCDPLHLFQGEMQVHTSSSNRKEMPKH